MRLGILKQLAVWYLALPVCLFFMGWLQPLPAIACIGALLFATWRSCRYPVWETHSEGLLSPQPVLAVGLIEHAWVFMSGIGGFTYQKPVFHRRIAIQRDLSSLSRPVVYTDAAQSRLLYHFTCWLPCALFRPLLGWSGLTVHWFALDRGGSIADPIETLDPALYRKLQDKFVMVPGSARARLLWLLK